MKMFTTFRTRLLLTFLGLLLIGFGGLTWVAGYQMAENSYGNALKNLEDQSLRIVSRLNETLEDLDEEGIDNEEIGKQIIAVLGEQDIAAVVWDSQKKPIHRHHTLPEDDVTHLQTVNQLLDIFGENVVKSDRTTADLYAVAKVVYESRTIGYIYLVESSEATRQEVWEQWRNLALALISFSLISLLCSLWLLSSILRPLSQLRDTALRMAEGDLSQRVVDPKEDEIGQVGQAFNLMADRVTAMLDEQRAFASNAAHELRTPLTTIRLRTESLRSGSLEPTTTEQYIVEIDNEATHMSGLVDDLLLLSKLDSKCLPIGSEQIDALRLTRKICRELGPLAEQKLVSVTLDEPDTLLPPVQTTMGHLHMVIRNLLENAIKYTPSNGQVRIRLAAHPTEKNVSESLTSLRIEISDTGQGIAQEDLLRITQRFYRDAKARARHAASGSGLGLALVDSIIKLYGGQLQITSPGPNQGTTATVLWPFQQEGDEGMRG